MNLTTEQVKNLNILADFMDGLNDPKFTMSVYVHPCGSPACALGWACTIPTLQQRGLDKRGWAGDSWKGVFGFVTHTELFNMNLEHRIKTPQQWAAHCRAFLKANGYATTDPFKTFMDRVMVPVDTKETTVEVK